MRLGFSMSWSCIIVFNTGSDQRRQPYTAIWSEKCHKNDFPLYMSFFPEFVEPYLKHVLPRDLRCSGKKKRGNSGPLFLAGNVEVWLLKVAAAATVAAMVVLKASIQEWWIPFWVTETPCLPEASLSSIPPSHEPSVHTSVCLSIRPLKLLKLLIMSMRPALKHTHMCVCFRRRGNRRVVFK